MSDVTDELCACGRPLHYANADHRRYVERFIAELGADVKVTVEGRSWMVPRHYIALHGIKAVELPSLGFKEVTQHMADRDEPKIASREDLLNVYAEGLQVGMDLGKKLNAMPSRDWRVSTVPAESQDHETVWLRDVVTTDPKDANEDVTVARAMGGTREEADALATLIAMAVNAVLTMPDCLCRTPGCGHPASEHTGPYGMCIVAGCDCGPKGWR